MNFLRVIFLGVSILCFNGLTIATSYTWNGSVSNDWATSANWTFTLPGNYPGSAAGDNVTINSTGVGSPVLSGPISIANFTFSAKTLDLNNFTLTVTGTTTCSTSGNINSGSFTVNSTSGTATIAGTTFGANVSVTSYKILLNGSTYNGTAYFEKTGASADTDLGGNTFNLTSEFKLTTTANWVLGDANPDIFTGNVTFTNTNTSILYVANNSLGNQFNGDIIFNSTGTGSIIFCSNTLSSATLGSGILRVGSLGGGVTSGSIYLKKLTQSGTTNQSLTFSGTSSLTIGQSTSFNGNVEFIAPRIVSNNSTYFGTAYFQKTGATVDTWVSGNTFHGNTTIKSSSAGLVTGGSGTGTDLFNADLEIINTGTGQINIAGISANTTTITGNVKVTNTNTGWVTFAYSTAGNTTPNNAIVNFNGNIELNNTSTGEISFGKNATNSTPAITLAGSKNIFIGAGGFGAGSLYIRKVTQNGSLANSLQLGLTGTTLTITESILRGGGAFSAASIFVTKSTFSNNVDVPFIDEANAGIRPATNFTRTGITTGLISDGDNIFFGPVTYTNNSSGIYRIGGNTSVVQTYYSTVTFNASGTANIQPSYSGNTVYKRNIIVTSTTGQTISFSPINGASSTLQSGATISAGAFGSGSLILRNFTQEGATTPQNITLTGSATLTFASETSTPPLRTVFYSTLIAIAPNLYLNGATFNAVTYLEKTVTDNATVTNNAGNGGNIFNSATELKNSGIYYFMTANANPDIFNGDLILTNTNTGIIYIAHNSSGNQFNGNVILNNTSIGTIYFSNSANGNAILASGKTLNAGTVSAGIISLKRFTQLGSTAQNITLTGSASFMIYNESEFHGNLTVIAPSVYINGGTFFGTVDITKNGTAANTWTGGTATFKSDAIITNAGSGAVSIANAITDVYNYEGNVVFNKNTTATLHVGRAGTTNYYKNLTYNVFAGTANTFGSTIAGINCFKGSYPQTISSNVTNLNFTKILIDKDANDVILNVKVTLTTSSPNLPELTLTKGNIISNSTNYVSLLNDGIINGGSSLSFVDGPFRKTGDDAITFPVGKGTVYAPISMSAPAAVTDGFQVEYFNTSPTSGTITSPLLDVSNCEYWNTQRITGSSSVSFTLPWPASGCSPINTSILRVGRYNGTTSWVDAGANSLTGSNSSGSITTSTLSSFGPLTFGYKSLLVLDTRLVNPTTFHISSSAETLPALTSGASGTSAGTKTMVSNSNNIPGVVVIHPSLSSTVPLTIDADQQNSAMSINLAVDATNNISSVQGDFESSMYDMSNNFYSVQSQSGTNCKVVFSTQEATSTVASIATNLPDGLTFNVSSLTNFQITIGGTGFTQYNFKVFDKNDQAVYSSSNILSSPVSWSGVNNTNSPCADGVYKYELDVVSGVSSQTYYGQLILKQ